MRVRIVMSAYGRPLLTQESLKSLKRTLIREGDEVDLIMIDDKDKESNLDTFNWFSHPQITSLTYARRLNTGKAANVNFGWKQFQIDSGGADLYVTIDNDVVTWNQHWLNDILAVIATSSDIGICAYLTFKPTSYDHYLDIDSRVECPLGDRGSVVAYRATFIPSGLLAMTRSCFEETDGLNESLGSLFLDSDLTLRMRFSRHSAYLLTGNEIRHIGNDGPRSYRRHQQSRDRSRSANADRITEYLDSVERRASPSWVGNPLRR